MTDDRVLGPSCFVPMYFSLLYLLYFHVESAMPRDMIRVPRIQSQHWYRHVLYFLIEYCKMTLH